jgi:hypothetical protein
MGTYTINVTLTDTQLTSWKSFNVLIANLPPVWVDKNTVLSNITMKMNDQVTITLPPYYDPEGGPVHIGT